MAKPVYVPTVAEGVLEVARDAAWAVLVAELGISSRDDHRNRTIDGTTVTETAISFEPPWRLVLDVTGGSSPFHQETVVLVPADAGCLAMWSALVIEPADQHAQAYADAVSAAVPGRLDALVSRLG